MAPRFPSASDVPRRIGRYDLLAPLGRGGMASVYLARSFGSAGFERLAAVKLLHRGMCADPDFVEMFLDEARVAARLHHPNATAIIDLGSEGPLLYMVMEYVQGDTLYAVQCAASSRREAIPLGIALRVVLDALAGLDAAHELRGADGEALQLIHRDVTPHNVIIGVDGAARLADFGIARAASRTGVTSVGVVKGKVPFMAPEHIRGRSVDRRADIFSMGVTLWETLSLRRCFPDREAAPFARRERESYRSLRAFAPHAPAAMDAICRQAMAFQPADRYPTAAAFAEALESEFRCDIATQRELGQFISVAAGDKVRREREAVRLSSQPMPDRPDRPPEAPRPAPVFDFRPPRTPEARSAPGRALRSPLGDGLEDGEDVTAIAPQAQGPVRAAPPRRPPAPPRAPHRPVVGRTAVTTLPRAPDPGAIHDVPTRQLTVPGRARAAEPGSLYEVPTQAFALQRPRPPVMPVGVPVPAAKETVRPPAACAPGSSPPASAAVPTVGPPRLPAAEAPCEPSRRPPRSARPPSRRPRPPSPLRALATRLWRLLVG